jgi:hypothetical protein
MHVSLYNACATAAAFAQCSSFAHAVTLWLLLLLLLLLLLQA